MWHTEEVGWGWWLLMSLGMVAFWALVIYGLVWLARGGGSPRGSRSEPVERAEPAREVLKRRLAAGDITVEEYEELRRVIEEEPAGGARDPTRR
jgi:putative membrane protein